MNAVLKRFGMAVGVACAFLGSPDAQSQGAYPNKPVRLIVPFPPGGMAYFAAQLVGEGGPSHLAVQLLNMMAEIKTQPVAYKGTGPLIIDMLSGRIDYTFSSLKTLMPSLKTGKLRALAVGALERPQLMPELPTFSEAGLPGFTAGNWHGIVAPKNTPQPIVLKVAADLRKAMDSPRLREIMDSEGMDPFMSASPDAFLNLMQSESDKFGKLIQSTTGK